MMKFAPNTEVGRSNKGLPPEIRKFLSALPRKISDQIDEVGFWEHKTGWPDSGPAMVLCTPGLTDLEAREFRGDFTALDRLQVVGISFYVDNSSHT